MQNTKQEVQNNSGFTLHHFPKSKVVRNLSVKNDAAFTLIELLVVLGVLITLTATTFPAFRSFQKESDLTNSVEEIINALRFVQNKTLASEENSQWGVWFSTSTTPHQYTLFRGENYALRASSSDRIHKLPKTIEFYEINLAGGEPEVVFNRVVGTTNQSGKISLRLKDDTSKTKQVVIGPSGQIMSAKEATSTDENRVKDSRHVHFDYTRQIATSTETLKLTFTYNASTVTEDIVIIDNIKGGQINWDGKVDVDGEIQELKIHTHRLNDTVLGTQFCVHRDKRYNTKALKIEIDGDPGSNLIRYTADGQTTKGTSVYVSEPNWQ